LRRVLHLADGIMDKQLIKNLPFMLIGIGLALTMLVIQLTFTHALERYIGVIMIVQYVAVFLGLVGIAW
jgi:hypothetical protein